MWFTNGANESIGRITTAGKITYYYGLGIGIPAGIASGPDGALWFTSISPPSIGRITTTGVITSFTGAGVTDPYGIARGSDGAMWFTNSDYSGSIGRITRTGAITNYTGTAGLGNPNGISAGPDGAVWFTTYGGGSIGQITVPTPPTTVPGPPPAIAAVPYPNGSAKVIWRAPTGADSGIIRYIVTPYLGSVAQPARSFYSLATNALVKGLQIGKAYTFTVAAANSVGIGEPSRKSAPMIVGAPGQPGRPAVVRVAPGSLQATFAAPNNDGAAISSYTMSCASSNGGITKSGTGSASPVTDAGLTPGTSYTCTVKATNSRGTGPASVPSAPAIA